MVDSWRKLRAFDLFCGAGGSSCGAEEAGLEIVGGIDLWDRAIETFQLNFPSAKTYNCRTDSLRATLVAKQVGPVDLLLASPECTNHSVAKGAAPRDEKSRRTAYEVIRYAKALRPRWVVIENVVSMQSWQSYPDWMAKLQKLGYHIRELKLNASHFQVPQSRRRLIIVADRLQQPSVPRPKSRRVTPVRKIILEQGRTSNYSFKTRPLFSKTRAPATLERARRAMQEIGEKEPFLLVYYGSDAAGGWQSVERPLRTITTLDRFALVTPTTEGHQMRMLQPPELAAAMGFPKTYLWPLGITRREHIKLIGNAVAPPMMKAVVKSLLS
jgi:DNA (cytosine-5)-methyltransferase 1